MIIDIKKLKIKGITNYDFDFNYNADQNLINLPNTIFDGDVKVTGDICINKEDIDVYADVIFKLKGECSKCLEPASTVITCNFSESFLNNKNITNYYYINDKLDLTDCVNDIILMNMPFIMLCKEDCKGLCPKCGINLNIEKCNCENQ